MRILIMFDLPIMTPSNMRDYRAFRTFLVKSGFIMMQESIYTRLALNAPTAQLIKMQVRNNLPPRGLVQMMTITEKQFANMELLCGTQQEVYIDNTSRLIEI